MLRRKLRSGTHKTKKRPVGLVRVRSFVLEVPLRNLRPSIIYSVPCDRILQRVCYRFTLFDVLAVFAVYLSRKWRSGNRVYANWNPHGYKMALAMSTDYIRERAYSSLGKMSRQNQPQLPVNKGKLQASDYRKCVFGLVLIGISFEEHNLKKGAQIWKNEHNLAQKRAVLLA